jgi:hypothetical protein
LGHLQLISFRSYSQADSHNPWVALHTEAVPYHQTCRGSNLVYLWEITDFHGDKDSSHFFVGLWRRIRLLQDTKVPENFAAWKWRQCGPPKCWYPTTSLHGMITQTTEALWTSETSVSYHIIIRRHNPEDRDLNLQRSENSKSDILWIFKQDFGLSELL